MASSKGPGGTKSWTLTTLTEDHKRWIVFGIALNHVLVPLIRRKLNEEISIEYNNLKLSNHIDVQVTHSFPAPYPAGNALKYENINANNTKLRPPHYKKYDYSKFDYRVTSFVDFAKLFLPIYMVKFTAFDETCDASAVLNLLQRIPIFPAALQNAANVVRDGRNMWGHCNFADWNEASFTKRFGDLKCLVKELKLSPTDEQKAMEDVNDWEKKGVALCMNATIDADLVREVQQHACQLSNDVEKMTFEMNDGKLILGKLQVILPELEKRLEKVEDNVEVIEQRVSKLEDQNYSITQAISDCCSAVENDIHYYAQRRDEGTRHWLLNDFDAWFENPDKSRAYVLLGDAAVGKTVMAAVIAQRAKKDGNLAAAHFCRHYDGTRRDPRYLLGSVAYQMCNCNGDYNKKVGGEAGIQNMLAVSLLGVNELFTKLLEEPLCKCLSSKRKLVVIDALDESEYSSRDDFLDLIMERFHRLPDWLLFFITSRPEDSVKFRLRRYNPCIRICAGNSESQELYQQHEQDIQRFLEKRVNFSNLPYSLKEIVEKCSGMFLYAFYMVEILNSSARLNVIFPETINDFFLKNFKRIYDRLGKDFYKKLFGCVLMAPSPLPISFISFLLRKEGCALDEQKVIDAVSLFVQTTNQTFTFLHNLIPTWLTDEDKASRRLFIYRNEANTLFTNIVLDFLNDFLQDEGDKLSFVKPDLVDYILHFGFRFIRESCSKTVFTCLTNYQFLQRRIWSSKVGIYFLIEDLEFSNRSLFLDQNKKSVLGNLCSVLSHDKHVIAGCPELLSSCLRNASEHTQGTIVRKILSGPLTEPSMKLTCFPLNSILCDIDCGAFSHDKKFFAGGLGRFFFILDALTLQKVFGPIEVIDSEKLWHLEFSSNDEFVFFGRLDKWFSVQEKRVVEISQFAGNVNYYNWGSFVYDGCYIAVIKNEIDSCDVNAAGHIFLKWWLHEICLEQDKELKHIPSVDEIFCTVKDFFIQNFPFCRDMDIIVEPMYRDIKKLTSRLCMCLNLPCNLCQSYGEIKTARAQIIHLFADIFRYQIWNVKTGTPVIEEMFCKQLGPFFYLWHIFPSIKTGDSLGFNAYNTAVATIVNFAALITLSSFSVNYEINLLDFSGLDLSYIFDHALSPDGKFVARKHGDAMVLVETKNNREFPSFGVLECYCFTNDSNYFLYVTQKPDPKLYAVSLQTRKTFQSISGLCSVVCTSKEDKCFGYIFCRANERIVISLGDLSGDLFRRCLNCDTSRFSNPLEASFTSTDTVTFLYYNGMFKSWKIGVNVLTMDTDVVLIPHYTQNIHVKECAFSHNGKLIAINHNYGILLLNCEGYVVSSVFKITDQNEHTVSFLTFSSDASLLVFCINKSNNSQFFFIWDVQNDVLSNRIDLLLEIPIDCACFSQDNSKIFFCNASAVYVYNYPSNNCPNPTIGIPGKAFLKCSHCVVSPDNKLLVCCIGNEILVHQLDGRNALQKVPHNHSGLIKSCKFLKGGHYLLSCDMEGVVLLFDLSEWKSVAYAKLQESISTITVSPDEDKVVCLGPSGKVGLVNLHGLKCGLPSNFQLPSAFRLLSKNREQVRRGISPSCEIDFEMEDVLDEDAQLSPYCSESGDEEGLNDVMLASG